MFGLEKKVGDAAAAVAELQAGVAFPMVVEAVDLVEFNRSQVVDEMFEHAASAHCGELARITDENDPPLVLVGEASQLGQSGRRGGAGFVDDYRRASSQVVAGPGRSGGVGVFGEQLVQCVGPHPGFGDEHLGCRRGWCHPKCHAAPIEGAAARAF